MEEKIEILADNKKTSIQKSKWTDRAINLKKIVTSPYAPFVFLFLLMVCFLYYYVKAVPGDDIWAKEIAKQYNLFDYIHWRYDTWSGRLPFEALGYIFVGQFSFLWPLVNAIMSVLVARGLWIYSTLGTGIDDKGLKYSAWMCCFFAGLFGMDTAISAMFWMSGSTAYLWPLAFGITAYLPFVYALRGKEPKRTLILISCICSLIAGWGQEQVSISLLTFSICAIVCLFFLGEKVHGYLWIQTAITAVALTASLTAPGNFGRIQSETATWFPDFFSLTLIQRVSLSLRWLTDRFINQTGLLLIFVWGALAVLLFLKGGKMRKIASAVCAVAAVLLAIGRIPPSISRLFGFIDPLKAALLSVDDLTKGAALLPYLTWVPLLLAIPACVFVLYGPKREAVFPLLLCGASFASALLMTFSPTLYASGSRTMFVPSALLILLLVLILKDRLKIWILIPFAAAFGLFFVQLSRLWASGFYV